MEEDQNDIYSCDSNASGGDSKTISRDSKTSSADSNASGGDSKAISRDSKTSIGDSNAIGGDNNASAGDNNACNHDRNYQTVNKANSGSSSQEHSNKLMANNGRGDEGASKSSEKSFNWQLQLNGRYDN